MTQEPTPTPLTEIDPLEAGFRLQPKFTNRKAEPEAGHRGGEEEIGVLLTGPVKMKQVSPAPDGERDRRDHEEEAVWSSSWRLQSWMLLAGLAVGGVVGLFLFAQVASIINAMANYPPTIQIAGYSALCLLVLAVALFFMRLATLWYSLAASPRISLKGLSEYRPYELKAKRTELTKYLRRFDIKSQEAQRYLRRLEVQEDELAILRKQRNELLDASIARDDEDWLRRLDKYFLATLDKAAGRLRRKHAVWVVVKTAATPPKFAGLDRMIVLYRSFALIGDTAQLYQMRAGATDSVQILFWSIVHTFFAGEMSEALDKVADSITTEAGGFVAGFANNFAGEFAAANLNGLMTWRLGRVAQRMIRPVNM